MSREIKFRAWDKKTNKMYYVASIDMFGAVVTLVERGDGVQVDFIDRALSNVELMQYTGLDDKNGVEIYEGDLLGNTMEGFAIAWDKELHSFWPINQYIPEDKSDVHWYEIVEMAYQGRLEVIGNIYENPEILEAEL